MPTSILATKLYAPPARPEGVTRPRLLARLSLGPARKLTLVSAPAGFGKSTLVTQWIAALRAADDQGQQGTDAVGHAAVHVAWLALDEGDNDFTRFLAYVIAALQRTAPHVGDGVLRVLDASQPPPNDALLTALLNDLAALDGSTVLVLDDYHMLENREIDQAIAFLLEHAPPHFRLVMTSREDPPLPLARYRARGQLTEVRAADLRFTPEEAAVFLNQAMGLSLSAPAIAALERRTEGWIAGLQLAALSMQGRADADAFVQAFAGDNRYILDYLVEEVLQDQPDAVRRFLLHTSILTRLTGPLCDAVTVTEGDSVTGGSAQLDALERANLFVISLDDRRQWYRYHHLFADVLRAHLRAEEPDLLPTLHARASRWYEQNGFPGDAIRHALAAEDFSRAAVLLERVWPAMDRSRQAATWRGWLTALPDEQVRTRPVLCVAHAWALLDAGALEAAAEYLDRAEQLVDVDRPPEPAAMAAVVDDVEQFRALPASIATARAYLALAHDDLRDARAHAQQALARLPAEDHLQRGVAAALLGLAAWADGDLAAADQAMSTAAASFQTAGNVLFAITGAYVQAEMRAAQGRLHAASEVCHRALALAEGQGEPVVWGTADLYTGLGELSRERNRLDEAAASLARSRELSERTELPRWRHRWLMAQARLAASQGDADRALALLDDAARHYVRGPVPDARPVEALTARFHVAQGRVTEALDWAQSAGLAWDDDVSYMREFGHLTLARALLAAAQAGNDPQARHRAHSLLDRLLSAAEAGGRTGSVIEILVVQALAHGAQGDITAALVPLQRALALAEPQGYVRIFADEGAPMAALLTALQPQAFMPAHVDVLLAACRDAPQVAHASAFHTSTHTTPPAPPQPLIEPLTERELDVLRLIADGLSNREIGERLFLALSTVKGYNRNIFDKLQVKRRTEAVARARALGLI